MRVFRDYKIAVALMVSPFIVACSGEPSEKDIKKAIQDSYIQETNSILSSKIGEVLLSSTGVKDIKLENIEKINCVSHAKNSYVCEYVMEYTIKADDGSLAEMFGAKGKKINIARSKFLKTSKSWIMADE
jgi:hypothetical protein